MEEDSLVKAAMEALVEDPSAALRKAEEALSAAKTRGDRKASGQALQAMSSIYAAMDMPDKALSSAEEALKESRAAADKHGEIVALGQVVSMLVAQGELDQAAARASEALAAFKGKSDATGEMAGLVMKAEVSMALDRWEEAATSAQAALDLCEKGAAKEAAAVGVLVKLSQAFSVLQKGDEAAKVAEEAVSVAKGLPSKRAQCDALNQLAIASVAQGKPDVALAKVEEALACAEDAAARRAVMQTKISVYIANKQKPEARAAAQEAAKLFREAKDAKGEASAQLLVADVCIATAQSDEAAAAAMAAYELYTSLESKAGQAAALLALATADFDKEDGKAVWAAGLRAGLFKDMGQRYQEAEATLLLADARVARLGKKLGTCSVPSVEDSMGALEAAKEAHALFGDVANPIGQENAMRAASRVLLYNNVPPHVVESASSPSEVYSDVVAGKYSHSRNAFPAAPLRTTAKIDEIVPSAKQLDRNKFGWTNALAGLTYALVWQPAKDRQVRNRQARGSYDVTGVVTGTRSTALPTLMQCRSNLAAEKQDPLAIYMMSPDCRDNFGTQCMAMLNTVGAMILAKLPRLTFVMLDESYFEVADTYTSARQFSVYVTILGMIRSSRIEAPKLSLGFVGGDAASWFSDPAPMIESIFDVVECDESELIYNKGDAYAPLLINKPMEEPNLYVKARKKAGRFT